MSVHGSGVAGVTDCDVGIEVGVTCSCHYRNPLGRRAGFYGQFMFLFSDPTFLGVSRFDISAILVAKYDARVFGLNFIGYSLLSLIIVFKVQ